MSRVEIIFVPQSRLGNSDQTLSLPGLYSRHPLAPHVCWWGLQLSWSVVKLVHPFPLFHVPSYRCHFPRHRHCHSRGRLAAKARVRIPREEDTPVALHPHCHSFWFPFLYICQTSAANRMREKQHSESTFRRRWL